jgi:hypothetical protein
MHLYVLNDDRIGSGIGWPASEQRANSRNGNELKILLGNVTDFRRNMHVRRAQTVSILIQEHIRRLFGGYSGDLIWGSLFGRASLGDSGQRLARGAQGLEPATDVYLRVRLSTEMSGRGSIRSGQVPLDDGKLFVSAFDHKPVNRVIAGDPANLALKFR